MYVSMYVFVYVLICICHPVMVRMIALVELFLYKCYKMLCIVFCVCVCVFLSLPHADFIIGSSSS
jgi:hypothetical protein